MKAPRKPAIAKPSPGKVSVRWGDAGPWQEFERRRHKPLTDEEFREACKTYFPTEMQPLAAAWILEKVEKARRTDADTKAGVGRPPGGCWLTCGRAHDSDSISGRPGCWLLAVFAPVATATVSRPIAVPAMPISA
jgi:hypothetical protein